MSKKRNTYSDLQGASRLTKEAFSSVIDIVEEIHSNVLSLGGLLSSNKNKRTTGFTGMVYKNIRSIADISGNGLNTILEKLALVSSNKQPTLEREMALSILNGVIGDHLERKKNPLAIPMQFRQHGMPVNSFSIDKIRSNQKLALFIHGACMNDLQWNRKGHDHSKALANDLGYVSLHLHYNTGKHVSENGEELTESLEKIMHEISSEIELVIVAHSMGGLVCRSAVHYGGLYGHGWMRSLRKIIFLGTPHHGAPLEQIGNSIDNLLQSNSHSAPISKIGKLRSAGITDLRYGNILNEDWNRHDRFAPVGDQRKPVPLPSHIQCYSMAVTMSPSPGKLGDDLIGDGLVPLNSALGIHQNPDFNLSFPQENQWIGRQMKHLDLLSHPDVYATLSSWVQS